MTVDCPGCGRTVDIGTVDQEAAEFCTSCDYPLFWVPRPAGDGRVGDGGPTAEAVLRRRPGAGGLRQPVTVPCPNCRELNDFDAGVCGRCGADMHPPPPPPPPDPPPPPPPEPEVVFEQLRRPLWWLTPALVALVLFVILLAQLAAVALGG